MGEREVTRLEVRDTIKRFLISDGLSESQTLTFLGLINVYLKTPKQLEVLKLLPVLENAKRERDTLGTSLGTAIDYMAGKTNEMYTKYNPDLFFSIIGLHCTLCEIYVQSKTLYPAVSKGAEKLLVAITSNKIAMDSIEVCIQQIKNSSIGAIDIFCPLLSVVADSRTRSIEESYKVYQVTLLKGPLSPVFRMKKN